MPGIVTSDTSVFGYLLPEHMASILVGMYSQFLQADPSALVVPLHTRSKCLESALHNVRTGLVPGMLVDSALYEDISDLVDSVSRPSFVAGLIDTVYLDTANNRLVGDCIAVRAFNLATDYMDSIQDPTVFFYGGGWETLVGMTALSGIASLMVVHAEPDERLDSIPTGCFVEYADSPPDDLTIFDLVVNPPEGFKPADGQHVLSLTPSMSSVQWNLPTFEAYRLAYAVGKFRGIPDKICTQSAMTYMDSYFKNV